MVLVFILVIITGIISFILLNRTLENISSNIKPDRRLILTKTISNELKEADNNVKSFSLTQNDEYLKGFYQSAQNTDRHLNALKNSIHEDDSLQVYLDSLGNLVETKYLLLDSLLEIQDEYRVQQALDNLVSTIHEDSLQFWEEEKEGFFRRLFKGKKRKAEEESARQAEIEAFSRELNEIRREEIAREQKIRDLELKLINRDRVIMERISALLTVLDRAVVASMQKKTDMAEKRSRQISWVIGAFVLLASLLLIIAIFTIIRFVKRNNKYKLALESARTEALNLARTRESFLANMSHEIRTPMNVISGFTRQLLKGKLIKEQREQLNIMQNAADHLIHILNDILDFSRLEAGKLSLIERNIILKDLLEDIVLFFSPAAKEKNNKLLLQVDERIPEVLKTDPIRLRQILINLIGNSIKFTRNGKVEIRVESADEVAGSEEIRICVEDNGRGIAREDLQKIFHAFEQSSSDSEQSAKGTGLGLAITKKLTDLFGGNIYIKSEEGKGTEISVLIPVKKGNRNEIRKEEKDKAGLKLPAGLDILVIDDEEYNRQLLKAMLSEQDVEITEAENAEEGLELFEKLDFDIVLSDIRLPKMSGTDFTRKIRQMPDERKAKTPVIALTASVTRNDQEKYKKAGMDDFLPKPVQEEDLIGMINRLAGNIENVKESKSEDRQENVQPEADFDTDELKRLSNDDEKFYHEMIDLFILNTESGFEVIRMHLENHELEEVKDQAHKIVSPARHLKANKLISLLKEIENMESGKEDTVRIKDLLDQAENEFNSIKSALKA